MGDAGEDDGPDLAELSRGVHDWLVAQATGLAPFRGPRRPGTVHDDHQADQPFVEALYDAGWTRYGWPEELGGLGGGPLARATVYDAVIRSGYRLPERLDVLETVGSMLAHFDPELAAEEIPALLRGERMWAQCLSEPEAGSDLASLRTSAVTRDGRIDLRGQKIWSSYGHIADRLIVLARTGTPESRHRGLTMLWVDTSLPGIVRRPIQEATGHDHFTEVFFDDVRLSPRALIGGEEGRGWAMTMYFMQFERGMYAWIRQAMLHERMTRLLGRCAGAAPAAELPVIADVYRMLSVLRARTGTTVARLDRGETPGPEVSVDKILLSTTEQAVFDLARRLGRDGFLFGHSDEDEELRRDWFYSRVATVYGGAIEVQRDIVAEHVLGLPRERVAARG